MNEEAQTLQTYSWRPDLCKERKEKPSHKQTHGSIAPAPGRGLAGGACGLWGE